MKGGRAWRVVVIFPIPSLRQKYIQTGIDSKVPYRLEGCGNAGGNAPFSLERCFPAPSALPLIILIRFFNVL